ncbi:MAG: hypothetical protein ACREDK_01805, partial [Thermoplasmata archaeon]
MGGARVRARIVLRKAVPSDVPLLVEHRLRMWEEIGGVSPAALRAHAPTYRRWLLPRLTSGRLWGYVAGVRRGEIGG